MKKIKEWMKKNGNYIAACLLPWLLIVIHSLVRDSWLTGNGSILSGDAGSVYYEMYVELWNKVHQGGSLFYSWNTGMGTDFLVNLFQYMMSPFTLLLLAVPRSSIASMLQVVIVLKWSLAAFAMTYYFMHTRHNRISHHKKLLSLVFGTAFFFSNALIQNISHVSWGDVWILFPFLLLLEEEMTEGRGFKRFYLCLSLMMLCNFRLSVPVVIFLVIWYILQIEGTFRDKKRNIVRYLYTLLAAVFTGMLVIIPCVAATIHSSKLYPWENMADFAKSFLMSATDFIQRFFICDTLTVADSGNAMLYVSVTLTAAALLFLFVPMKRKKKGIILLLVLLIAGLANGGMNLLWHGYIGVNESYGSFAFLLAFLFIYMAMTVLGDLFQLKLWHVIIVMLAGLAVIGYTFFSITVYLDFYVYLSSVLLYVFFLLLLVFYCRKSIQYSSILVVFSILCLGELAVNAYMQMDGHNMYPIESSYYHAQSEVLTHSLELQRGERIAATQVTGNYGLVLGKPMASGELAFTNDALQEMYHRLGMAGTEEYYEYFGGSPLLNVLYNIRYGMSEGDVAFGSAEKKGENNGYNLYEMKNTIGLGYMVDEDITNWEPEQVSPFEAQNDLAKRAAGSKAVFKQVKPELICSSLLGGPRLERELEPGHVHHEEEEKESPETVVEFDEVNRQYRYLFEKMYSGDVVTAGFDSDGKSDYYIYVKSEEKAYLTVMLDGEKLFEDMIPAKQKTFHIGIVEKGKRISILTNAVIDDLGYDTLTYQIAAFQKENYDKVYEKLNKNVYQIENSKDNGITGIISADADGIMLTSVPAAKGWKVYVDGKSVEYKVIGKALIGVPLKQGEHKVEFKYITPYFETGAVWMLVGIVLFAGLFFWDRRTGSRQDFTKSVKVVEG